MSEIPKTLQDLIMTLQEHLKVLESAIVANNTSLILSTAFNIAHPLSLNLSAKEYYELFLLVFDGLSLVQKYLTSTETNNLYDESQYFTEIVPRLYVTITVGISALIRNFDNFLLQDMIEIVKGVQHPCRGLFLRYYLNKRIKDLLKSNSKEAFQFIFFNLSAMNSL